MKTKEQIEEMKAAKEHEEPSTTKSYGEGLKDGWIHCLRWILGG